MKLDTQKFNSVAEAAKAKTNDKRWKNAIDKAQAGVVSGWWIITELHDGLMVTTETGQTYRVNGHCSCRAAVLGQPCKHIALRRLLDLYNALQTPTLARESDKSDKPMATAATSVASVRVPTITRSVEQDARGNKYVVVRCDAWMV